MPKIQCRCKRFLSFRPEQAGKVVKCPVCSAQIRLPIDLPAKSPEAPEQERLDKLTKARLSEADVTHEQAKANAGADGELRLEDVSYEAPPPQPPPPAAPPGPVQLPPTPRPTPQAASPSFWASLPDAITFPLKGDGLVMLIIGTLFFSAAHYAMFMLGFLFLFGWLLQVALYVVITGYFAGYLMRIMEGTARGENEAPDWPDLTDYMENALKPFLFVFVLGIFCIGPSLAYLRLSEGKSPLVGSAILMAGMLYMPMAMLCVALTNDISGLNPVWVIRAIAGVPGRYLVAWVIVLCAVAAQAFGAILVSSYLPIPILGYVLQQAISFYFLFLAARIMGLLYRTSGQRLDWLAG